MHYSSAINRPYTEDGSTHLQVTSGCSHNRCRFCVAYKDAEYVPSPFGEIEEDLDEVARTSLEPPRCVFLQGANALSLPAERLLRIIGLIREKLPSVESVTGYGRMTDFVDKSVDDLRALHDAGFKQPYIGVETADSAILARVEKGFDGQLALEQGLKLRESGMPFVCMYIVGLGGAGQGMRSAEATAALFNRIRPEAIGCDSLVVLPRTPLHDDVRAGLFHEAGEVERIEEVKRFISLIDYDCYFNAAHVTFPFQVRGRLPKERDDLIEAYDLLLMTVSEERMRAYREKIWPAMMPEYTTQDPLIVPYL